MDVMESGRQRVPSPEKLDYSLERELGDSAQAIYYSTCINLNDSKDDQVHYNLGMWGKIIILAAVKRYGFNRNVDVEGDSAELDWNLIFPDIVEKFPFREHEKISLEGCKRWFENRMAIYKKHFPNYRQGELAVDQLLRYYSTQLLAMIDVREAIGQLNMYWENIHSQKFATSSASFFSPACCTIPPKKSVTCSEPPSPGNQFPVVNPMLQRSVTIRPTPVLEPDLVVELDPRGIFNTAEDSDQAQGCSAAVIYHDERFKGFQFSTKEEVESLMTTTEKSDMLKLTPPSQPADVSTATDPERKTLAPQAMALLKILDSCREEEDGLLFTISQLMQEKAVMNGGGPFEYTVENLTDKIERGEVQSAEDVYYFCRCLISLYIISQKTRNIDKRQNQLLKSIMTKCVS